MTGRESLNLPRRRITSRSVNYNEREADAELAKHIEQLEESGTSIKAGKPKRGRGGGIVTNCNANNTEKIRYQKFLSDKSVGWNFIPSVPPFIKKSCRFSTILDLEDAYVDIFEQSLYNSEAELLKTNDTIYMVSEPPGEPYYIGRVVEFVIKPEFRTIISNASRDLKRFPFKFFQVKMNWFYRSRDIQNKLNNVQPRLLYASLHQDICPIESYRGKCTVVHEDEISTVAVDKFDFLTKSNNFYFNQLFDRYTRRYYRLVITGNLLKLQDTSPFLNVLNGRFKYLFVEENYPLEEIIEKYILNEDQATNRDDELWNERCSVCREWCSKSMSLKCEECTQAVHLYCLDTPLDRKPNKGIVWLCFQCIKRQEGSKEALKELEEDQFEEKRFFDFSRQHLNEVAQRELQGGNFVNRNRCWFQYAGLTMVNHLSDLMYEHLCLVYPMKFSRVGYRFQWSGCTNEKESISRPYSPDNLQERGADTTSTLLWDMKNANISSEDVDKYVERCKAAYAPRLNMLPESCNFLDLAVNILMKNDFDTELAFEKCGQLVSRELLQEPTFTPEEIRQFEDAVTEFGSELLPVSRCVKTQPMSMVVRYYYHWKKTPNGKKIWGSFKGRRKNMGREQLNSNPTAQNEERKSKRDRKPTKLALDSEGYKSGVELKHIDDSSFETENVPFLKQCFHCMFCEVDYSPMWYKVTGGSDDDYIKNRMQTGVNEKTETSGRNPSTIKGSKSKNKDSKDDKVDALCIRCVRIWRRYGVEWQSPLTVLKRLNGPSIASLYATLELIFNENNNNLLKLSPQQAYNKCLEWELVQDSELITKQREDMIKVPERLAKLKRGSMAGRAKLSKMVKRPFDRTAWHKDRMLSDLQKYLEEHQPKRPRIMPTINNIVNDSKDLIARPSIVAEISEPTIKSDPSTKDGIEKQQSVQINKDAQQNSPSNGDFQASIPLSRGDTGKIALDPEAKYLQFDDKTYNEFNSRITNGRKRISSDSLVQGYLEKRFRHQNDNKDIKTWNSENIAIIKDERDSALILNTYRELDPFRSKQSNEYQFENGAADPVLPQKSNAASVDPVQSDNEDLKDICNVCGGEFNQELDEELNCHGCGLSIHYYCYGVIIPTEPLPKRTLKSYKWYCDPCSNEINPIVSTNYRCDLCYVKSFEDGLSRAYVDLPDSNALKCTTSSSWCHVLCAIFNPDIKFGNAKRLQPIINVNHVIAKTFGQFCHICKHEGGGLIKCSLCAVKFHTTCAKSTPGFHLKMMMSKLADFTGAYKTVYEINGEDRAITPVAICGNHQNVLHEIDDLYPLNWKTHEEHKTLLQLYCENYKESPRMSTVFTRYLEQQSIGKENLFNHIGELRQERKARKLSINSDKALVKDDIKVCTNCGTDCSIFWYDEDICHACHIFPKLELYKFSENKLEQDQIHPRINEQDAAKILSGLFPVDTDIKRTKEEKKLSKSVVSKGPLKTNKWMR